MSEFSRFKIFDFLTVVSFILSSIAMMLVFFDGESLKKNDKSINKSESTELGANIDKSQDRIDLSSAKDNESEARNDQSSSYQAELNDNEDVVATSENIKPDSGDMGNLIKDLEGIYTTDKKISSGKASDRDGVKNSDTRPESTDLSSNKRSIHKILLKSFIDKDDAMLELNRMRLRHKDITANIETSVIGYNQEGRQLFGVFGKIHGDISVAEKYCEKFESRGVKCVIV